MRCWHLLCMDASTIAKTDHQTCACSQVHRYADCQRTAEHPVDQHAVWKRNHGASSGTCLKEPDYVADRFHHFLQPDEVDRADRRLPHVPCKNRCTGTEIKKNSDTIKTIHLPICRKVLSARTKRKRMGFVGKEKRKRTAAGTSPKGSLPQFFLYENPIRRTAILPISVI